jgi:uncharacterized protein (TIGR03067 family)
MTDTLKTHPSPEQLTAFGLGRLDERDETAVALHLEGCDACRTAVEGLPGDSFVARVRGAGENEPPGGATCADVRAPAAEVPPELAANPRYRVLGLLGAGGMGAVYRAEHVVMERPVALKVVNRALTDRPGMAERFRREVKAAARLAHPNIVTAYDADQAGDLHFLVMEYVESTTLARLVAEEGPLPAAQACEYVRQAALGLQYAHQRGMVHRDVKPHNLMLTPGDQVKVLDFGLARFALKNFSAEGAAGDTPAASGEPLTQLGTVVGTPDYIAPEQVADAAAADVRADVYSLGCTLYHLLTGAPPFHAETVVGKVLAHAERAPRPLAELCPSLPAGLAAVVERMMAKDPAQRYQTPAAVGQALAPFVPGAPRTRQAPPWGCLAALLPTLLTLLLLCTGWGQALLAAVGRVFRNEGTVEVVVDDDQVKWQLGQEGLTAHGANGRSYVLWPGAQHLKAGEYELQLSGRNEQLQVAGPAVTFVEPPAGASPGARRRVFIHVVRGTTQLRITYDAGKLRAREDQTQLQGSWRVTAEQVRGGPALLAPGDLLVLEGGRFIVRPGGGKAVAGTYRLDATLPAARRVEFLPAEGPLQGQAVAGQYVLNGDELRLYLRDREPGGPWALTLSRVPAARGKP